MSALAIRGQRTKGEDVRTQNVMACQAISNIVKSSLGPSGLDKMLVDEVGDVTITNDGATILQQLDVEHPAAQILVELSSLQDREVGDGTTSVVILAAEILKSCNKLVKEHIHPTSVISGLQLAAKEAVKYIKKNLVSKVTDLPEEAIIQAAKTSMSSKIIGTNSEHFSKMIVDAVKRVKTDDPVTGKPKYPIDAITILKSHGKSTKESFLVDGYALNCTRVSKFMPSHVKKAKIACLDMRLRKAKLPFSTKAVIDDPDKLADIRKKEYDMIKDKIQLLQKHGVNVILTTMGIDDMASKYMVEAGIMGVRRCKKSDIEKIARVTGGKVLLSFSDMEGNETVEDSDFGEAKEVVESKVGDGSVIFFNGCQNTRSQTIILRGANDYMLEEVHRSVHDAICVVKRTLESNYIVPGGGCVESALSIYMESFAETLGTREQLAIAAFGEALLIIPKTLATNAALDSTELVTHLRYYHHSSQTDEKKKDLKWTGLDLENGKIRNNLKAGVLEPALSKIKAIRFAAEAAITILRIDDSIKMTAKDDNPQGNAHNPY